MFPSTYSVWCWASDGRCDVSLCECKRPCAGCNVNFSAVLPRGIQVYFDRTRCFPLSRVVWFASNAVYHVNTCVAEDSELSAADINSICSEVCFEPTNADVHFPVCLYLCNYNGINHDNFKKNKTIRNTHIRMLKPIQCQYSYTVHDSLSLYCSISLSTHFTAERGEYNN